jgi:hypothetical protein
MLDLVGDVRSRGKTGRGLPTAKMTRDPQRTSQHVTYLIGKPRAWISYFNPITIESGPTSGSTRVFENPTSRIQA